jgi:hypothetical protein
MRVTSSRATQLIAERKGMQTWDPGVGTVWHMVVLGAALEKDGPEVEVLYMNDVHNQVKTARGHNAFRCVEGVIDAVTGKIEPCPLCTGNRYFYSYRTDILDKYKKENPGIDEESDTYKNFRGSVDKTNPYGRRQPTFVYMVAVTECDVTTRKPKTQGKPVFHIVPFKMTEKQKEKLDTSLKALRVDLGDLGIDIEDEADILTWGEFRVDFPDPGKGDQQQRKMDSRREMKFQGIAAPKACQLKLYPELKEELADDLAKTNLDGLEDQLKFFKPRPVNVILDAIGSRAALLAVSDMSEEEKNELIIALAEDNSNLNSDEAAALLNDTGEEEEKAVAPPKTPAQKPVDPPAKATTKPKPEPVIETDASESVSEAASEGSEGSEVAEGAEGAEQSNAPEVGTSDAASVIDDL